LCEEKCLTSYELQVKYKKLPVFGAQAPLGDQIQNWRPRFENRTLNTSFWFLFGENRFSGYANQSSGEEKFFLKRWNISKTYRLR